MPKKQKSTYKGVTKKSEKKIEFRMSKEAEAFYIFMDAGLTPLEPYENTNQKWKSKCNSCGAIVSPRVADVKGGRGGCKPCGAKSNQTAEFLAKVMQTIKDANLEPLEPYVNATHPWKCKCLKCGETVTPMYANIRRGHGGCIFCQVAAFKHNKPAYLYFIHHKEHAAYKIGIGNEGTTNDRIESHKKSGWKLIVKHGFEKGSQAIKVEKKLLQWIRTEKQLSIYLTNKEFKHGGASETFGDDSITELEVRNKISEVIKEFRDNL
jgi:formylmethanofuran dehydrogenase subunit E/predicted GIY-YIG superfamily endonuclease